ncbi:hypothetical protein [Alterisphingorhabdus coralli]|uniref:Uncharacterized protein n=1 Tax=Alterisphingorhabdus coralli TaxID=3071408 RepID=A0AA97FBR9_9SPHN|nr:hypothetical protein [Parasphingorhabdus sp. SCSIO 66989]WOE76737.1 hypothetical protein RB602_15235 [Parasphingorhabdus sp. SCSIO 66989]
MREHQAPGMLCEHVFKALAEGKKITGIQVIQHASGRWFIRISGDWLGGHEYVLGFYDRATAKLYKNYMLGIEFAQKRLNYAGPIRIIPYAGK